MFTSNNFTFRWFKHLSDATEAYKNKEGKPKNSDHSHEPEEETVQELPTSSREPTERAEAVGGNETTPVGEDVATSENNQSIVSESEKEKRLSHSESESCPSAGELLLFVQCYMIAMVEVLRDMYVEIGVRKWFALFHLQFTILKNFEWDFYIIGKKKVFSTD